MMKTRNPLLMVVVIVLISFVFLIPAEAADFSMGASVWYAWWDMPFEKQIKNPRVTDYELFRKNLYERVKFERSEFLYGPCMSLRFASDWSLSGVFMFGSGYLARVKNYVYVVELSGPYIAMRNIDMRRQNKYDLDFTLSYSFPEIVKVFVGYKYQGYESDFKYMFYPPVAPASSAAGSYEYNVFNMGPGAGLGATVPLSSNFYFLANLSGVFMWGRLREHSVEELLLFPAKFSRTKNAYFYASGLNATSSLAYRIEQARLTLSIGIRYQILWNKRRGGDIQAMNVSNDQFYGMTFSLMYTF